MRLSRDQPIELPDMVAVELVDHVIEQTAPAGETDAPEHGVEIARLVITLRRSSRHLEWTCGSLRCRRGHLASDSPLSRSQLIAACGAEQIPVLAPARVLVIGTLYRPELRVHDTTAHWATAHRRVGSAVIEIGAAFNVHGDLPLLRNRFCAGWRAPRSANWIAR